MKKGDFVASGSLVFCYPPAVGRTSGLMEDIHYSILLAP